MRKFAIVSANGQTSAWLYYDQHSNTGTIKINSDAVVGEMGPILRQWALRHTYTLPADDTLAWVQERVCPPGRENIREILDRYGLEEYNPYLLTIALGGKALCDNDHLEEIK